MSTIELTNRLDGLQKAFEKQSGERHQFNQSLHTTMLTLSNRQMMTDETVAAVRVQIGQMSGTMKEMAEDLRSISLRLVGDRELDGAGLVQEVRDNRARIDGVEKAVGAIHGDMRSIRAMVVSGFGLLTLLGGLLGWLQSTFGWPFGGGAGGK